MVDDKNKKEKQDLTYQMLCDEADELVEIISAFNEADDDLDF